ncbi:hypothetical protein PHMEG_00019759 [Phytophthora megakarya]|uniref:MULE transposase domain-containing protein n=1 Tax=Phytophthora megakarya TaxID=4795 RepID=A0A225VSQ0_9STRA|nr:hypothetical protein PHMEG_00019759 [Phytophthora megakarya]
MKQRVDSLSIADLTRPVHDVWQQVCAEFYPDDDLIRKGLSEEQVTRRVYHVRQKHYGSHLLGFIEVPPLSIVEGKHLSFFQFHLSRPKLDPTSKPDRRIGWAHPELRRLLMYNGVSLFFDGTFRCVPIEFKQCMVLMVHDQTSELFVPIYFVLCSSKGKEMYCDVLEQIYRDTSKKLQPCDVVCDFELPLINAIETKYPSAEVIGCLFHFKQAVRRRMKITYSIPNAEIRIATEKGVLDILTVIDLELVPRQGIRWVKRTIRTRCDAAGIVYTRSKWRVFWGYFRETWLEQYNIDAWNVHGLDNDVVARTNNPLERLHRELNRSFPTPHPSIATFVRTIRTISKGFVAKLTDVAQGRRKRGNKRNVKTRKRSERIDLPVPVHFTEADAVTDSESEEEMVGSDTSSVDKIDSSEEGSSEDELPDYSYEPGQYCDNPDSYQAALV